VHWPTRISVSPRDGSRHADETRPGQAPLTGCPGSRARRRTDCLDLCP